jgi:hypothetical protein
MKRSDLFNFSENPTWSSNDAVPFEASQCKLCGALVPSTETDLHVAFHVNLQRAPID